MCASIFGLTLLTRRQNWLNIKCQKLYFLRTKLLGKFIPVHRDIAWFVFDQQLSKGFRPLVVMGISEYQIQKNPNPKLSGIQIEIKT